MAGIVTTCYRKQKGTEGKLQTNTGEVIDPGVPEDQENDRNQVRRREAGVVGGGPSHQPHMTMDYKKMFSTSPGASEPQGTAAVSGSGAKAGSNVAGSLRSSASDRERAGVASQAPATLQITSAAKKTGAVSSASKRKIEVSPKTSAKPQRTKTATLEEKTLQSMASELHYIRYEAGASFGGSDNPIVETVDRLLAILSKCFDEVSSKSPASKTAKKEVEDPPEQIRPCMMDSSTDMELTPSWWDSEENRTKAARTGTTKSSKTAGMAESEAETGMETDGPWVEARILKGKKRRKPALATQGENLRDQIPPASQKKSQTKTIKSRPPAILVRPKPGATYADTVRAVRGESGINVQEMGAQITVMRKTRDGNLLLELKRGQDSVATAAKLGTALSAALGEKVEAVRPLGLSREIEILDLDAVATADEVRSALLAAAKETGRLSVLAEDSVKVTGIWPTKSGNQIATARVSRAVADAVTRIPVGWTMCRVRPRRTVQSCYRCHGYGHTSSSCTEADLSANCRRCGKPGHIEKTCTEGQDHCVACDRAGLRRVPHRPGSGRCQAWKAALKTGKG